MRIFNNPNSRHAEVHLLSNGRYHVASPMPAAVTVAGAIWLHALARRCDLRLLGSFHLSARCDDGRILVRRVSADSARDQKLRGYLHSGAGGISPAPCRSRNAYRICVSPEDDVELRRVTLTNHSATARTIELTSYAEVVLATQAARTRRIRPSAICSCRLNSAPGVVRHSLHPPPALVGRKTAVAAASAGRPGRRARQISCETDRSRFVGPRRNPGHPGGAAKGRARSRTPPVRCSIPSFPCGAPSRLQPQETAIVDFVIGVAENRESRDWRSWKNINTSAWPTARFDLAWTHSQVMLRHLNATEPKRNFMPGWPAR